MKSFTLTSYSARIVGLGICSALDHASIFQSKRAQCSLTGAR